MLFASIQPYEEENYYTKKFIFSMAQAAKLGGAKGLRIEGIENINYVKKKIDLPIIGLIKKRIINKQRYICPTFQEIDAVADTECEYLAIDYTLRDKLDKNYYLNITEHIRKNYSCNVIADISNIEEAKIAKDSGVDYISTALRGYTSYTKNIQIPDIEIISQLKSEGIDNIIAEGGYSSHSEYIQALKNGAKIIVVGTAITRPHLIIKKIITGNY